MIELYQAENCPWCVVVRDRLMELGLSYISHNPRLTASRGGIIQNQIAHRKMVDIGGNDQIPFLVDNSTKTFLYESSAIVEYLDKNYGK